VPAVADLLELFDFVPRWRLDDVMVSLAAPRGTVGPHVDGYDVFLLQGRGRRRWRIDTRAPDENRPGLDLRILKRFRAEEDWILGPGDMLYLPPGVAHWGVAVEGGDCLTYSIGFRAPAHRDLVLAAAQRVLGGIDAARLFRDPGLRPCGHPGEIAPSALARMRRLVQEELRALPAAAFQSAIGRLLTSPAAGGPEPPAHPFTAAALARRLRAGDGLRRSSRTRIAYARAARGALLFVDGDVHPLPAALVPLAGLLAGARSLDARALLRWTEAAVSVRLLTDLVNRGAFAVVGRARAGAAR
jgi:50S ribosomal protein L16 3-hydroxylase